MDRNELVEKAARAALMVTQGDVDPGYAWRVQDSEVQEELLAQARAVLDAIVPDVIEAVQAAKHARWYCEVYESGYHNGSRCRPTDPHRGFWNCSVRAYYDNAEIDAVVAVLGDALKGGK